MVWLFFVTLYRKKNLFNIYYFAFEEALYVQKILNSWNHVFKKLHLKFVRTFLVQIIFIIGPQKFKI